MSLNESRYEYGLLAEKLEGCVNAEIAVTNYEMRLEILQDKAKNLGLT